MFGFGKDFSKYRLDGCWPAPPEAARVLTWMRGPAPPVPPQVDLRPKLLPVEDVHHTRGCVSMALLPNVNLSDKHYSPDNAEAPSALFSYYNARQRVGKENEDSGVGYLDVFVTEMMKGHIHYRFVSLDDNTYKNAPSEFFERAAPTVAFDCGLIDGLEMVKFVISQGWPVLVRYVGPEDAFRAAAKTGKIEAAGIKVGPAGVSHALSLVGYDNAKKHVIARNCWGKEFGDNGHLTIAYDAVDLCLDRNEFWFMGDARMGLEKQVLPAVLTGFPLKDALVTLGYLTVNAGHLHSLRIVGGAQGAAARKTDSPAPSAESPDPHLEALKQKRQDLRAELQGSLDTSRQSIRDRMRAQEDQLAQKRNAGGGGRDGGGNQDR